LRPRGTPPISASARVSTTAQNLDAQVNALTRDVVVEKAPGRREARPELARFLARLREGDTLVVS
jgi:DNA invertase Pin-like site-specific DNA recombinase